MAIIAKDSGKSFDPIDAGLHVGRCVSMIHIGTVEQVFKDETKSLNKVQLTFELPNELKTFDEEKEEEPRLISQDFTLSMSSKGNLRKTLESWRGKPFSEDEAKAFDVTKLLGVACMINVIHKESNGKTYANISAVTPPAKGMDIPEQITPSFEFNYENCKETFDSVPEWIQKKIAKSEEFAASGLTFEETSKEEKEEAPKAEKKKAAPKKAAPVKEEETEEEPLF